MIDGAMVGDGKKVWCGREKTKDGDNNDVRLAVFSLSWESWRETRPKLLCRAPVALCLSAGMTGIAANAWLEDGPQQQGLGWVQQLSGTKKTDTKGVAEAKGREAGSARVQAASGGSLALIFCFSLHCTAWGVGTEVALALGAPPSLWT